MAANQERDFYRQAAGLLVGARSASLATVSGGMPHAALVTPALDAAGQMILLLSDLSAHTRHLRENAACALLVTGTPSTENPQTAPRILLSGVAELWGDAGARAAFLQVHPYAELYCDFADFQFWRLVPKDAHYVGGFAAAARLEIAALQQEINAALAKNSG
jgi:putative heme iron utilization protein